MSSEVIDDGNINNSVESNECTLAQARDSSTVSYHKHCQATVLSAAGTSGGNGTTWNIIGSLNLPNLIPSGIEWKQMFLNNTANITQDLATILTLINNIATTVSYASLFDSTNGTQIGTLTVNSNSTAVYAPKVEVKPELSSGTKIGTVKVGDTETALYAPSATSISETILNQSLETSVVVTPIVTSGNKLATIKVRDKSKDIYAPKPVVQQTVTSGTQIGSVDGTALYSPRGFYVRDGSRWHYTTYVRASGSSITGETREFGSTYQEHYKVGTDKKTLSIYDRIAVRDNWTTSGNRITNIGQTYIKKDCVSIDTSASIPRLIYTVQNDCFVEIGVSDMSSAYYTGVYVQAQYPNNPRYIKDSWDSVVRFYEVYSGTDPVHVWQAPVKKDTKFRFLFYRQDTSDIYNSSNATEVSWDYAKKDKNEMYITLWPWVKEFKPVWVSL